MDVTDNELNWRRVFPDAPTDVSGWTLANRMKLPDWCFGTRQVISKWNFNSGVATRKWTIADVAMPDPCCIWQASFYGVALTGGKGFMRIGLADAVPTSEAEMDATTEILPEYGATDNHPREINLKSTVFVHWSFDVRMGLVTGGKKLVMELYCNVATIQGEVTLVVSALPTEVPAFLDPQLT